MDFFPRSEKLAVQNYLLSFPFWNERSLWLVCFICSGEQCRAWQLLCGTLSLVCFL